MSSEKKIIPYNWSQIEINFAVEENGTFRNQFIKECFRRA